MKNTMKIRMIGAAALLGIGASAFPSLAAGAIRTRTAMRRQDGLKLETSGTFQIKMAAC